MSDRPVLEPSSSHPITTEPTEGTVTVRVAGQVVAESRDAITLREASYPPVQYVPIGDVRDERLRRSDHTTYCPYKGDASYFDVVVDGHDAVTDAVWTYERAHPAVADIAGHVAFYPDKVDITLD